MIENNTREFNKFQEIFFPIHKHELKKFLPMSFLMFLILFVYNLTRSLKDLFVQYSTTLWKDARPEESTSLLSALKFWYVLPCAFIVVIAFTALLNKFGPDKSFHITIIAFMVFYGVFGYLIYPNLDHLIMSEEKVTLIVQSIPTFFRTFVICAINWPISLFYIMSELWGTMAISSLFWQFANRVTLKHEVKRFFGLFSLLANIGTIIAGGTISNYAQSLDDEHVRNLMIMVLITCSAIMATYSYINKVVLKNDIIDDIQNIPLKNSKKPKVSAMEGIKILVKNPYLLLISVLIIAYGVTINFSQILMKASMKETFDKATYAQMQGILTIFTGIFGIIVVLLGTNILRKFSWKTSAIITPLAFLIFGGIFFCAVIYKQFIGTTIFGVSAMMIATWFGIINDALVRSIKYSLFDSTKSMAYIPLDEASRTKGQAATEMIGGRIGKAGSSMVQQVMVSYPRVLVTATGSYGGVLAYTPHIVGIFFVAVIMWIFAVLKLSNQYEEKVKNSECAND